jgi:hypothetical protein
MKSAPTGAATQNPNNQLGQEMQQQDEPYMATLPPQL